MELWYVLAASKCEKAACILPLLFLATWIAIGSTVSKSEKAVPLQVGECVHGVLLERHPALPLRGDIAFTFWFIDNVLPLPHVFFRSARSQVRAPLVTARHCCGLDYEKKRTGWRGGCYWRQPRSGSLLSLDSKRRRWLDPYAFADPLLHQQYMERTSSA